MTTPTDTDEDNAARGIHLAATMCEALSLGDEPEVIRLANTADDYEIRYAATWLTGRLLQVTTAAVCGNEVRAREILRELASDGRHVDAVDTAVQIILRDARRDAGV